MTDWFKLEKEVCQGCILSPCLFKFYAEHIMQNAMLDKSEVGIKIAGRNINFRYADVTTLMAESKEELKSLFSPSLLSAIRVVSSAYLRLVIFLQAILILACASSSLAFHMMYSAYKLNKQGDNIRPWHTPFSILNQSIPCLILIVTSWPAYKFLRRQVRWSAFPSLSELSIVCCDPHSQRLWHSQ